MDPAPIADLPLEVTPQEAHAATTGGGAVLLDVREPWEWRAVRIPGALLIPLVELPARRGELPAERDLYIHCRVGRRSLRAVEYLRRSGRSRVSSVAGGIAAWRAAGLPIIAEP
jgi:rhodanese-related sulfurtransferase